MSGIREQKKRKTRKAILEAAVRLFADKGFEQTSLDELAREAGIGKATIYGYFANKNEIFLAYCEEEIDYAFSILEKKQDEAAPLAEQLVALMLGQLSYVTGNREFGRIFAREMLFPDSRTSLTSRDLEMKYLARLTAVLTRGQETGELPAKTDLLLLMGHLHALYIFTLSAFYQGDIVDLDEAATLLRALVAQTLAGPGETAQAGAETNRSWENLKRQFLQRRNLEL